jgi:hypothetical protein
VRGSWATAAAVDCGEVLRAGVATNSRAGRGSRRVAATCSEEQRPGCSMEDGRRQRHRRWEPQARVLVCRGASAPALGGSAVARVERSSAGASPCSGGRQAEGRVCVCRRLREDGRPHRALGLERHLRRLTKEKRRGWCRPPHGPMPDGAGRSSAGEWRGGVESFAAGAAPEDAFRVGRRCSSVLSISFSQFRSR